MSIFVESSKRLYAAGKITATKLDELLASGKISQDEYSYITGA